MNERENGQTERSGIRHRPGMSLKELMDNYNADCGKLLAFDGFVVLVNETALTTSQVRERILSYNDKIFIISMLAGG